MKYDPAVAWRALTAGDRDRLGMAFLLHLAAMQSEDEGSPGLAAKEAQRWGTASAEAWHLIEEIAAPLTDDELIAGPDLSVLGIRSCSVCGCTDHVGCEPPCHWVAPDLCSACGSAVPE